LSKDLLKLILIHLIIILKVIVIGQLRMESEVQIANYEHENYLIKGEHVEIKGYMKVASKLY